MSPLFKIWVYYGDYRTSSGHNARLIDGKLQNDDEIFDGQPHRAKVLILTTYRTLTSRHGPSAAKYGVKRRRSPMIHLGRLENGKVLWSGSSRLLSLTKRIQCATEVRNYL
ncbi:hypothetical protein BDV27DRAFT_123978 [Aspergillus caelatus]|uniref:Uncharacterized protein n=1 Tax=Aspergillus caelatus TaxID=61420 RepID=A0A5N7ABY1_9EURO|nr:uncharacterized protein BDV27DRAFT_123978 [Aspergillus caelatus]KAE8367332.1 hypothetical protein BDV27DRAFT_123978 [Aspergillus caelatus]